MIQSDTRDRQQLSLSQQQEDQIREVFGLFDTDGGGTMDRQELRIAMRALGFQGTKLEDGHLESQKVLDAIDTDGSNSISLDEFTAMMKGELLVVNPLDEIRAIFTVLSCIDGEHDPGFITLNKLRMATQTFQIRLSEEELELMISQADDDECGTIDEEEFIHVMSFSPWFWIYLISPL